MIMIFWCLSAFIISGYGCSVANMTILTLALFAPDGMAWAGGWLYNLLVVTLVGVLCVALPYWLMSEKGRE